MEFLFQRAGLEEPNEKDSAPMDNVNGIISAFSNLRVNDTMVEKQAENDILEYMRHPESILSFMYIITNCDVPVVRLSPMLLMCVVPPNGRSLFEVRICQTPLLCSETAASRCDGKGVVRTRQTRHLRRGFHPRHFRIEGGAVAGSAPANEFGFIM